MSQCEVKTFLYITDSHRVAGQRAGPCDSRLPTASLADAEGGPDSHGVRAARSNSCARATTSSDRPSAPLPDLGSAWVWTTQPHSASNCSQAVAGRMVSQGSVWPSGSPCSVCGRFIAARVSATAWLVRDSESDPGSIRSLLGRPDVAGALLAGPAEVGEQVLVPHHDGVGTVLVGLGRRAERLQPVTGRDDGLRLVRAGVHDEVRVVELRVVPGD